MLRGVIDFLSFSWKDRQQTGVGLRPEGPGFSTYSYISRRAVGRLVEKTEVALPIPWDNIGEVRLCGDHSHCASDGSTWLGRMSMVAEVWVLFADWPPFLYQSPLDSVVEVKVGVVRVLARKSHRALQFNLLTLTAGLQAAKVNRFD